MTNPHPEPIMRIPAITVRQPWAGLMFANPDGGPKDVENRSSNIVGSYRGLLAIHAGARRDPEMLNLWDDDELFPRSTILGVVQVVDVHRSRDCLRGPWRPLQPRLCSPWALSGQVHIQLSDPQPIARPIEYQKGKLGMWWLPDDVAHELLSQLDESLV